LNIVDHDLLALGVIRDLYV